MEIKITTKEYEMSLQLDGTRGRKKNRESRENSYNNLNSNDMMGAKSLVVFVSSIFRNPDNLEEKLREKVTEMRERELINKMREKLQIGESEAIKFLKSDEFKNINDKSYKFNEKDIEQIEKGIKNKGLKVEDILDINKNNVTEKEQEISTNKNKNINRNR
jgi:hypothetical protein